MKKSVPILAALAFVAGALLIVPQASAATVKPNPNAPVSSSSATSTAAQDAAVSHWTPAAMESARNADTKPVALSQPPVQSANIAAPTSLTQVGGTLGNAAFPQTVGPLRDPVTRSYTNRPDRLNGKVFFTEADGFNYVCSGTLVNSSNKSMVDTAGHCVANGAGSWNTNWVFVPAYSSRGTGWGDAPYGIWPARTLSSINDWVYNGNLKEDYGYGVLANHTWGSWRAVDLIGGQGTYFNAAHAQTMQEFGYPQAAPYNGFDQRYNVSVSGGADDPMGPSYVGSPTIMIKSSQTGGTSGGGWIVGVSSANGLGHVNGHSSYRYIGGPKANSSHLYGPYYGTDALNLFKFTQVL